MPSEFIPYPFGEGAPIEFPDLAHLTPEGKAAAMTTANVLEWINPAAANAYLRLIEIAENIREANISHEEAIRQYALIQKRLDEMAATIPSAGHERLAKARGTYTQLIGQSERISRSSQNVNTDIPTLNTQFIAQAKAICAGTPLPEDIMKTIGTMIRVKQSIDECNAAQNEMGDLLSALIEQISDIPIKPAIDLAALDINKDELFTSLNDANGTKKTAAALRKIDPELEDTYSLCVGIYKKILATREQSNSIDRSLTKSHETMKGLADKLGKGILVISRRARRAKDPIVTFNRTYDAFHEKFKDFDTLAGEQIQLAEQAHDAFKTMVFAIIDGKAFNKGPLEKSLIEIDDKETEMERIIKEMRPLQETIAAATRSAIDALTGKKRLSGPDDSPRPQMA